MSGNRREYRNKDNSSQLKLYSIFKGEVVSVQEYGAFVKIPNHQKNGLVHRSQISYSKVDDAKDVLDVGDGVFCKIISLGEDNDKIALSMKCVNQGSGVDQDPNHLLTLQDEQRKKSGGGYIKPKIELGAIFNTNCRQCGGKGHLASECFQSPGSKTYDILPDKTYDILPEVIKSSDHKKKKKEKKLKKKKQRRKHHSDTDSDSSSDDEPRRTSKHKKSKKSSHKRSQSTSDSDSSSEDEPKHKSKHKKSKKTKTHKRNHSSSDNNDSSSDDRRKKKQKKEKSHHHEKSSEKQQRHRHQDRYR